MNKLQNATLLLACCCLMACKKEEEPKITNEFPIFKNGSTAFHEGITGIDSISGTFAYQSETNIIYKTEKNIAVLNVYLNAQEPVSAINLEPKMHELKQHEKMITNLEKFSDIRYSFHKKDQLIKGFDEKLNN